MERLVYFSSGSGNTARFVERLALPALRIPIRTGQEVPRPARPFVLICPTYSDGEGRGAVPKQVIAFLNDPDRRALIRGVIGAGNRNFGPTYALAARIIAQKCAIPLLARFELAGTDTDIARIRDGLDQFWREPCLTP